MDGELDLLAIQAKNKARYPYFLDSAAHGDCFTLDRNDTSGKSFYKKPTKLGRFSILFAYPQGNLCLDSQWHLYSDFQSVDKKDNFLDALDLHWNKESIKQSQLQEFPFCGGWFIFLAYELANQVEPVLDLANAHQITGSGLPIAFATRIPAAIIVDHLEQKSFIFAEAQFEKEFLELNKDIENLSKHDQLDFENTILSVTEENSEKYLEAIRRTHEYIYAGDIFQANLSREWQVKIQEPISSTQLYKSLRTANPGPFAGCAYFDEHAIMSSSPERLLEIKAGQASTRPIAGTRARGKDIDDDKLLREELIKHPKERAEHIMLIDLERNDLGRICKAGTVEVNELMVIETYEHVHHIVSNVRGQIKDDVSPGQAIKAVFPGGTITGCPKVRCMQIIAELEDKPREAYTGSMGYLNHNGDMDLNILIRTMHLNKNKLNFRAGGGIVYDSNPEKEVHETRAKARGLLKSLEAQSHGKQRNID